MEDPRVAVINSLTEDLGMTVKEIGKYMNLSPTSVANLKNHGFTTSKQGAKRYKRPGGYAARRGKYGPAPMWTQETCLAAGRRWIREHGEPPVQRNWEVSPPGRYWPAHSIVKKVFGSWADFMLELGYLSTRGSKPQKIV